MTRTALALAAPLLLAGAAGAQVGVVYEQPPATSEGDVSGGYYSNAASDTLLYDAFSVPRDAVLDEIQLWGFGFHHDARIDVTVYMGGGPQGVGPAVGTRSFAPADMIVEITEGWIEDEHAWWREERATLAVDPPIRLLPGREYWIGVGGQSNLIWSYRALGGDLNILYSNAAQEVFWDQNDTDMAFRLAGRLTSPADLGEPYLALDFADVVAFLVAFAGGEPGADLAPPSGLLDHADVVAFLHAFGAGVP